VPWVRTIDDLTQGGRACAQRALEAFAASPASDGLIIRPGAQAYEAAPLLAVAKEGGSWLSTVVKRQGTRGSGGQRASVRIWWETRRDPAPEFDRPRVASRSRIGREPAWASDQGEDGPSSI